MSKSVKRPYSSTRRQEQADETRLRILAAAHELFVAKGYGRTTIAEIAASAGVAVETIYAAFRNKPTLLRQVWFVSFRGDERGRPPPGPTRDPRRPRRAGPRDPLRRHAVVVTAVFRRITPLLAALQGAAASEPAAAAMLAEWDERRLEACTAYAAGRRRHGAARGHRSRVPRRAGRNHGRRALAAARRRERVGRRALRRLARPPLDRAAGQGSSAKSVRSIWASMSWAATSRRSPQA